MSLLRFQMNVASTFGGTLYHKPAKDLPSCLPLTLTATELKNSLGHCLDEAKNGKDFIVAKDGAGAARLYQNSPSKIEETLL